MTLNLSVPRALIGCLVLLMTLTTAACDFPYKTDGTATGATSDNGTAVSIPSPRATPELDSVVLFGASLVSAAVYCRSRLRNR